MDGTELNEDNYYSDLANYEYMSVSQFKDFNGTYGRRACEAAALAKLKGEWKEEPNNAMLVGSYVDRYFEGTLDSFKQEHQEIFKRDGTLKAEYNKANLMIQRAERDELFMKYMSGEKQVIMTAEVFGTPWKIKMDSYLPGIAIVDLKVMASLTKLEWVRDIGYLGEARNIVEHNMSNVLRVKRGQQEPMRCECCRYCRETKVLKRPIGIADLTAEI